MPHAVALDVLGGRIQTIRSVIDPDKPRHVGPLADAWAIDREPRRAHRSPGRPGQVSILVAATRLRVNPSRW